MCDASTAPHAETTAIRLVGLLPADWTCVPEIAPGRIRLRVLLDEETGSSGRVRRRVAAVLRDPALRGWRQQGD
ncbi:hypothetical protein [Streptomyces oceani]|uniref:hypothetical protein n=1 Tax=Streptomyces oceani TaxID=1075402 RepID=UPI000872DA48|nr:hypothetical protein [Streptomyces oceani]